ncbi:MAG: hypothetical protein K2X11_14980 [Acetobacteraceae bacterium]|nr:hypothetical protein [Acetobacteraceae bacterium]
MRISISFEDRSASRQRERDPRGCGNRGGKAAFALASTSTREGANDMRGILLWLIGIPIPIIIALYLFGVL